MDSINACLLNREDLAGYIDYTLLKPDATTLDVTKLCNSAMRYGFKSVCINPCYIPLAVKLLNGSKVIICTVIGFPLGASSTEIKTLEASAAIQAGAAEIDMVMNIGFFKSGLLTKVQDDLARVVTVAKRKNPQAVVKFILETSLLNEQEIITACRLAMEARADFVKTATGFGKGGATIENVILMRRTVGSSLGVKAAGGIRDLPTAMNMIKAGANRIGTSSGEAIMAEHAKALS